MHEMDGLKEYLELKSLSTAPATVAHCRKVLSSFCELIPPSDITPENKDKVRSAIISFFSTKKLAQSTKTIYYRRVREFVAWRFGEYGEDYAPLTMQVFKGIKIRAPKTEPVSKEKVILYEEWEQCMRAVDTWRDKLILAALFEGGFRAHELLGTNVGDWHLHDGYVECHIRQGKTGPRTSPPMAVAAGLMKMYLQHEHPDPENPSAPMITPRVPAYRGRRMTYKGICELMDKLNHRLGDKLGKHIHAHMFRKGCCSYLYLRGVDDLVIRQWLGWTPTSTEPQKIYRWVDREREKKRFLVAMGIIDGADEGDELPRHHRCMVCGTVNTANALFCSRCGTPLKWRGVQMAQKGESAKELLLQGVARGDFDPEDLQLVLEAVKRVKEGKGDHRKL